RVVAGDAATLTVEVRGKGNVKALPPPQLPKLAAVEIYPPVEEARVETKDGVVRGVKRFSWVVLPERSGTLEVPAIEYAFFDTDAREYATARTDPMSLVVLPTTAQPGDRGGVEVGEIETRPWGDWLGWVRTRGFAIAQLVPLLALLVAAAVRQAS